MGRILRLSWLITALAALLLVVPPTPSASAHIQRLTIDANGTISPGNALVTVTGQIQCSAGEGWRIDFGTLSRGNGKNQVVSENEGEDFVSCDGTLQSWQVIFRAPTGQTWHNGKATAVINATSCVLFNERNCAFDSDHPRDAQVVDRTISLH